MQHFRHLFLYGFIAFFTLATLGGCGSSKKHTSSKPKSNNTSSKPKTSPAGQGVVKAKPGAATSSTPMPAESIGVLNANSGNFKQIAVDSKKLVMIDFWATWCGPCKMISPIVEDLSKKYKGQIMVVKVDADRSKDLADQYKVKMLPTILFMRNGKVVDRVEGVDQNPRAALEAKIKKLM
ncbi:MAG: thioredoxin [Sphingobacteriales bacterium]|nr:thioredoxin [Sphingobacteriales bacterium]